MNMAIRKYFTWTLLMIPASLLAQSDLVVGTNYELNIQRRNTHADAFILHNARTDDFEKYFWETTHPTFGFRGIQMSYLKGMYFYTQRNATTADQEFVPEPKMVIRNEGNVGIGTSTPPSLLTVNSSSSTETVIGSFIRNVSGEENSLSIYGYTPSLTSSNYLKGTVMLYASGNSTENLNIALPKINGNIRFLVGGWDNESFERMRIQQNGNVGIGTLAPEGRLEVKGPYTGQSQLIINTTSDNGELRFSDNGTPKGFVWYEPVEDYMAFGRGGLTNSIFINTAGDLGVGTATPSHKLDVNGAINATEIRLNGQIFNPTVWNQSGTDINYMGGTVGIGTAAVPTGYQLAVDGNIVAEEVQVLLSEAWPDYVFEKDYELKPLEELERFVKTHKHLPEVPSAADVEKEGQGLGAMNALLLKKIEELTLYLIQQQKTIDELMKTNEEQQEQITMLSRIIQKD